MPAKSEAQRRLFAIAEHHPSILYKKNKGLASLPYKTLHEFASKVEHGFYGHLDPKELVSDPIDTTGGFKETEHDVSSGDYT